MPFRRDQERPGPPSGAAIPCQHDAVLDYLMQGGIVLESRGLGPKLDWSWVEGDRLVCTGGYPFLGSVVFVGRRFYVFRAGPPLLDLIMIILVTVTVDQPVLKRIFSGRAFTYT